jgi:hypothetical protein
MCHNASLWLWVPAFAGTTAVDVALALSRRRPGQAKRDPGPNHRQKFF